MSKLLRILYLEDSASEAELVIRELRRFGFDSQYLRVSTEAEFHAGLETMPDLIFADYSLPQFDGLSALSLLLDRRLEIPFILISGTIGEDAAVASIKQGAADYLMKDRLSRLGSAVERALSEQKLRFDRKQAEAALRQSEECLRIVTGRARVGLGVVNMDHCLVFANAAFAETFNLSIEDLVGKHFGNLLPKLHEERIRPSLESAFAGNRVDYELCLPKPDGSCHYVINYEPVMEGLRVTNVVVVVIDITARRNAEEQLRHSQKMEAVGQLAGGIAHDFNNLLTVISGYTGLLLQSSTLPNPVQSFAIEIGNAAERAADLTRRLLAFSRQQMRSPETVNLNDVISETQKLLHRTIGEDLEISLTLDPILYPVWVDRSEMSQLLLNLSINARDAMPNGGRLGIQTQNVVVGAVEILGSSCIEPGEYVMLTVSDSGSGMTEAIQQKIFEPFFTTKPVGKGTGLGLAIVHGIVGRSGGFIRVSSTVGVGTVFHIYFPHVVKTKAVARESSETERPMNGTETILLVEDDESVRQLARTILTECGYKVVEAKNGQHALKKYLEHKDGIHMLISDLVMPDISGVVLAEHIRGLQSDIRILFISGYIFDQETRDRLLVDNRNFLQKPFSPKVFASRVRAALDLHESGIEP